MDFRGDGEEGGGCGCGCELIMGGKTCEEE